MTTVVNVTVDAPTVAVSIIDPPVSAPVVTEIISALIDERTVTIENVTRPVAITGTDLAGPPGPAGKDGGSLTVADMHGNTIANVTSITFTDTTLSIISDGGGAVRIVDLESLPPTGLPLGIYGDACTGGSVNAAWTPRNTTATASGSGISVPLTNAGDGLFKAFTDAGQDFSILVHLTGLTFLGGMYSVAALDSTGAGICVSGYSDGNGYVWATSSYGYSGTGPIIGVFTEPAGDHWLQLRRTGGSTWQGRWWKASAGAWTSWSGAATFSGTITQIGLMRDYSTGGTQTPLLASFKSSP